MGFDPVGDLFGRKPKVPKLPAVDIDKVQRDTVAGNAAVLPGAQAIASSINTFNYDQALAQTRKALNFALPGAFEKVQDITNSQLAGELSSDETMQLQRQAASSAFGGGTGASLGFRGGIGSNAFFRNFGISSMQRTQQGIGNFERLAAMSPKTTLFDLSQMFLNTEQRFSMTESERNAQYNRAWLESQIKAAPHPIGQFVQNVVYAVAGTAGRYFGVSGGGGAGGGGGGVGAAA